MNLHSRIFFVLLPSTALCGCQKNNAAPKLLEEHQPNLSVTSLTDDEKCITLAQASFGDQELRNYVIASPKDPMQDVLLIEFTWTDGVSEHMLECSFKSKSTQKFATQFTSHSHP